MGQATSALIVEQLESGWASRFVKGLFDRAVALVTLLLLSPILITLFIAVRLTSEGPALYKQERVGRHGIPFRMVKIRTMVNDADEQRADLDQALGHPMLFKMKDDPRVTRLGGWLRRWSLDELPQFWNVLTGDMSLVGPRPLPHEADRYEDDGNRRLLVRPGITGLWQVSGRSNLPWEEALKLDLHYIDNWSLALDAQIIIRTPAAVLRRHGAY